MEKFGNIKIYFGKVINVSDDNKIYRCQIKINGYTDELDESLLPWYFPWYGKFNLPLIDDTIPVIIFDDNFTTGFYGNKLDLTDDNLDEEDYSNYLEIFKRFVDDNNIQLTYKKSTGIEFINGESKQQIELDKISLFCKTQSIVFTEDIINIGNSGLEASLMGDRTVKELQDIILHQANTITEMYKMFLAIQNASMGNPYTVGIGTALQTLTTNQKTLIDENNTVNGNTKNLQSKTVYINE